MDNENLENGIDILCEAYAEGGPLFQYIHGNDYSKKDVRFFFDRFIGNRIDDYFVISNDKGAIFWILPNRNYSLKFGLKIAFDYWHKYGIRACFRLIQLGLAFDSLKKKIGKNCFELNCFGVLPKYQGQGVGSNLLEQSFREIDNPKGLPYFLFTQYSRNVKLYEKFGFQVKYTKQWKQNTGYYMQKANSS